MPQGDGTGPNSLGPRTGRGLGFCNGYSAPGCMNPGVIRGMGRGFRGGRGRGFGRGMAWGRGFGWRMQTMPEQVWEPVASQPIQVTKTEEKQYLEEELKALKQEMEEIEKRLKEIKK